MATDPRHQHADPDRGPSPGDPAGRDRIPACPPVTTEIAWFVLCGPSAVLVLVLVVRHTWPVWWLVIAGMLIAWAGDALWSVGDHAVNAAAHRQARRAGELPASRAGEHR